MGVCPPRFYARSELESNHAMSHDRPRYLSYLIRMWRVKGMRGWQWRASLEDPGSGERHAFPSLELMFSFLQTQTGHPELDDQGEELDE